MSRAYTVEHFPIDYCERDISQITAAIKGGASLLAIGMPGCGKSRLVDFLLNRPGVLDKYGVSPNSQFIQVDGDLVVNAPHGIYFQLLQALDNQINILTETRLDALMSYLRAIVQKLEADIDLIIFFDNFRGKLQRTLGKDFFKFLFALRNVRPKLNISYIFMTNLDVDLAGFHKTERLFDRGADRSICWLSLFNHKDALFSIDRQLDRIDQKHESLTMAQKERIYELTGGHALLNRYLCHLMAKDEISIASDPQHILTHSGIRKACTDIWNDIPPLSQNLLIDLAAGISLPVGSTALIDTLQNYGVLIGPGRFFSAVFESFVKTQTKTSLVQRIGCDENQTRLTVKKLDGDETFTLEGLSQRQRRLLCYLLNNLGDTCAKDHLRKIAWPTDEWIDVDDSALSKQIDQMRKWLREQAKLKQYMSIETVWGEGYRLTIQR